jgi:hypothetical protein
VKNEDKNKKPQNIYIYNVPKVEDRDWLKAKRLKSFNIAIKRSRSSKVEKLRSLKIVIKNT